MVFCFVFFWSRSKKPPELLLYKRLFIGPSGYALPRGEKEGTRAVFPFKKKRVDDDYGKTHYAGMHSTWMVAH
jgi:hypothetical protein